MLVLMQHSVAPPGCCILRLLREWSRGRYEVFVVNDNAHRSKRESTESKPKNPDKTKNLDIYGQIRSNVDSAPGWLQSATAVEVRHKRLWKKYNCISYCRYLHIYLDKSAWFKNKKLTQSTRLMTQSTPFMLGTHPIKTYSNYRFMIYHTNSNSTRTTTN